MTRHIGAATKFFALLGHPVAHSLSPAMQQAALDAAGLDAVYLAMDVLPGNLGDAIRGLRALGTAGANVTVPYKTACMDFLDELSPAASRVGAVNAIVFRKDKIVGYNTDAPGFVEALRLDGGFDLEGKTYAQIGAGGAGRAMAFGAAQAGTRRILLTNRTREKADTLATDLRRAFPRLRVEVVDLLLEAPEAFCAADVVANATSLGMRPDDPPPLPRPCFRPDALVFDTVYTPSGDTPMIKLARREGICWTLDGRGMLIYQGALAFELWTGERPDVQTLRLALDAAVASAGSGPEAGD
jgi:shikimate dehydrogenase